jgi:thioredoxin 1
MSTEVDEIKERKLQEMMQRATAGQSGSNGWPDAPVAVTDATFDSFVKKYPKVVVDCWAPWCGPCRMLSPTVEALAKEKKGQVVFAKLNTDENYGTAGKFRIASIPTLLYFKDGSLVHKSVGAYPKQMVEAEIKKALG